jgi:hypothetical protein
MAVMWRAVGLDVPMLPTAHLDGMVQQPNGHGGKRRPE